MGLRYDEKTKIINEYLNKEPLKVEIYNFKTEKETNSRIKTVNQLTDKLVNEVARGHRNNRNYYTTKRDYSITIFALDKTYYTDMSSDLVDDLVTFILSLSK